MTSGGNKTCRRCLDRKRAQETAGPAGTVWSGTVFGVERWFNVSKAFEPIRLAEKLSPALISEFRIDVSVAELWDAQVSKWEVETDHVPHVNLLDPILLATFVEPGHPPSQIIIDGIHRVAKAHALGVDTLPAYRLTPEATLASEMTAEQFFTDQILTELVYSGAQLVPVGGTLVVSGGKPPVLKPDDHPVRRRLIRMMLDGPTMVQL